jgi:hypothetical protein
MTMFNAGPDVSLKGSPTVSPTTAALWTSEPLPCNSLSGDAWGRALGAQLRQGGQSEKRMAVTNTQQPEKRREDGRLSKLTLSMYFLALSQAPPEFDILMAN